MALLLGWRRRLWSWVYTVVGLIVPVGTMVLVGSAWPIYTDRYTLVAAPGLALVVGLGVSACGEAFGGVRSGPGWGAGRPWFCWRRRWLRRCPNCGPYYHDPTYWREDFERAAEYVTQKADAGDTVVLVGCSQPVMHYYRGPAQVVRFPQRGDSVQDEGEVVTVLAETRAAWKQRATGAL